ERDVRLFSGKTRQYIFISSASAYQKPLVHPVVTESTPLCNPYWQYSRDKIACEELLLEAFRNRAFPAVVVRPSHTYDTIWPLAVGPSNDCTIIDRMKRGLPILVHGDGTSLWTVTHSADFAKAFVGLIGHPQTLGHAYHITGDERLTWDQIHNIIAHAVGGEAHPVYVPSRVLEAAGWGHGGLIGDKAWSVLFDNTKIRAIVPGFRATIPFHIGVYDIVNAFEEPERQRVDAAVNERMDAFVRKWRAATDAAVSGSSES
ncbi:MAG: NAD-dependent epimerase/dehydratase family protein, partial [Opitutaceae bacterium]